MNTEGGRVACLLAESKECMAAAALTKARQLSQGCNRINPANVPPSSTELDVNAACYTYQSAQYGVPESVRIQQIIQKTLDASISPTDPYARFSEFRRPFIQVCPPIPQSYTNAGNPVSQGKSCPLPNKPDNLILPG